MMKPKPNSQLTFRELRGSDAPLLFEKAFGREDVTRYLQWDTHHDGGETKSLLEEMLGCHQRGEKYFWLGLSADDGRPVGIGSLKPDGETGWIGFLVFRCEQRKGVGSIILSSVEEAAFEGFECVSAGVHPDNQASVVLLVAAGYTNEATVNVSGLLVYRKTRSESTSGESRTESKRR